jgi:hypothetical protein
MTTRLLIATTLSISQLVTFIEMTRFRFQSGSKTLQMTPAMTAYVNLQLSRCPRGGHRRPVTGELNEDLIHRE